MEPNPYEAPKEQGFLTPDELDRIRERKDMIALWLTGAFVFATIMAGRLAYWLIFG
jgi:hypothetical protein